MSLLHEARSNIREERANAVSSQKRFQKIREEGKRELQAYEICVQLRSDSERLLDEHGSRIPPVNRDKLGGKVLIFFVLFSTPSIFGFDGLTPLQNIDKKELKTPLYEDKEKIEIKISSNNAVPKKSPRILIRIEGVPEYLTLYRNGQGKITPVYATGDGIAQNVTLNRATQYKEVLDRVREKFDPPMQAPAHVK